MSSTTDAVVDPNTQLLLAMLHLYHPSRDDCNALAAAMGGGVTGNAIRQRIQKLRKNIVVGDNNGGGGAIAATPAGTPTKGNGNGKAAATTTPRKAAGGGRGRKRARSGDDDDDEGDDDEVETKPSAGAAAAEEEVKKKAKEKTNKKVKVKREEDGQEVDIVATVVPGVPGEGLIDEGSFFFLQDEDGAEVV